MTPGPAEQLTSINTQIVQYIEVLLALGGVLVLAYVILRIGLPRMFGMRTYSGGPIQILARYPLEPKKALYLVKTGTQVFLIGTSESQVQFLTAIDAENAAEVLRDAQIEEAPRKDFRQLLSRFQKGGQS